MRCMATTIPTLMNTTVNTTDNAMTLTFRLMLSAVVCLTMLTWPWAGLDFLHALPIDFLYWHCKNAKLLAKQAMKSYGNTSHCKVINHSTSDQDYHR